MAYSLGQLRRDLAARDMRAQRWIEGRRWQWANRRALALPPPPVGERRMIFAIPLISRARASDWAQVCRSLGATLASLRAQGDPRWRAMVCCQDRPDGIAWDEQVEFVPYPHVHEGYDNHPKVGLLRQRLMQGPGLSGYWFQLDADDLLHRDLVGHVMTTDNRQGYLIERGYMLDHATGRLAALQPPDTDFPRATHFHRNCGSSSALWFDTTHGADFNTVLARRGNHRKVLRNMGYFGMAMEKVPFHAAIYVMNHGENLRARRGLMGGKMQHFTLSPVTDPARIARVWQEFPVARAIADPSDRA